MEATCRTERLLWPEVANLEGYVEQDQANSEDYFWLAGLCDNMTALQTDRLPSN